MPERPLLNKTQFARIVPAGKGLKVRKSCAFRPRYRDGMSRDEMFQETDRALQAYVSCLVGG